MREQVIDWQPIETAPRRTAILVWAPTWGSPGEGMLDDDGHVYSPCCGGDLHPEPTHWAQMPKPPLIPQERVDG